MDEIRKVVPWPLLDISTVGCKSYMVMPGIFFSFEEKMDGTCSVAATFSGKNVSYTGNNIKIFLKTLEKLVEIEEKRKEYVATKLVKELEKDRDKYKRKYKELKGSIKYAPGGEEYEKAKADFEENIKLLYFGSAL
ncbi:hypothetical protein [Brazilian marseillevirus]|uniref:hypothetical protein n=1 Tax=Brazilian marseillevirus TaxID=1813599 RepID=UPI0007832774|nr:hypothetical protein A3303_gp457 [Brazilian marseillevirus]AMQ10965.1 hypothetical protein [Brazilian marseillevirus]